MQRQAAVILPGHRVGPDSFRQRTGHMDAEPSPSA